MRTILTLLSICLLWHSNALAFFSEKEITASLSPSAFGGGGNRTAFSMAFWGLTPVGPAKIGLGARLASFYSFGKNSYTTADASLIGAGRVNTLEIDRALTFSANLALMMIYPLSEKWDLGMNIDFVGLGFGSDRNGVYAGPSPSFNGPQQASPSSFNALLGGRTDRGQLDSEFFVAYHFSDFTLRTGWKHFVSEYTTSATLDDGNRRFRKSSDSVFAALAWKL